MRALDFTWLLAGAAFSLFVLTALWTVFTRSNPAADLYGIGDFTAQKHWGCDGALVEHNTMRDCARLGKEAGAAAGIWPWSCDNTVIQFNEVSDHKAPWDAQGFDSDWNCRGTVIHVAAVTTRYINTKAA